MPKIAIITDTDSSLPADVLERYGILQVPMTIHFGSESFTAGLDLDDASLFERVERVKKLPTTSAPSPHAFAQAYQNAFASGADEIVCLCVSSMISSTYAAAVTACETFPGRTIRVIDTLNVSMGQGLMTLAAAEAARGGASIEDVVDCVEDTARRLHLYAVLSTLKYLALSGRVGKFVAGVADTFNIKPLLTVVDGKLDLLEKVRTRRKAIDRLLELVSGSMNGKGIERVAIIHSNNLEGARELQALLRANLPCPEEIMICEFGAGLSVHAGPGMVGVALVTTG
jgi:DegV family protein with EDD domain